MVAGGFLFDNLSCLRHSFFIMSELTSNDPILSGVTQKVIQQKKLFIIIALVFIAVIATFSTYTGRKDSESALSNDALYSAKSKLKEEMMKRAEAFAATHKTDKIDAKSGKTAKTSEDKAALPEKFSLKETIPGALEALKAVTEKHPTSVAGYEASMILGQLYTNLEISENASTEAASYFKKAAELKLDPERTSNALSQYAYALIATGKKEEALTQIEAALSLSAKSGIEADLLRQKIRLLEEKGDKTKAIAALDLLLKRFPNSEFTHWAEQRKASLTQ